MIQQEKDWLTVFMWVLYYLPTAIAHLRRHKYVIAITVLNLFWSWTLLGWLMALVWALCPP